MRAAPAGWLALALVATTAACDGSPSEPPPPGEEVVHSGDTNLRGGRVGQHQYLCMGGERPLVEFGEGGLRVRVAFPGEPALALTAPAQGLQYVGEQASATVEGGRLDIQRVDGSRLSCWRASRR